jgi:hypothetical protein
MVVILRYGIASTPTYLWSPFTNVSSRCELRNYGNFEGFDENGQPTANFIKMKSHFHLVTV